MQTVVCQGDYRVIQEVLLDNFAEVPPPVSFSLPKNVLPNSSYELNLDSMSIIDMSSSFVSVPATELTSPVPAALAMRFKFLVGEVTLELFGADPLVVSPFFSPSVEMCDHSNFNFSSLIREIFRVLLIKLSILKHTLLHAYIMPCGRSESTETERT